MPRFFFHLRDDFDVPDEEGCDLPDLAAARAYARDLARFEIGEGVKRDGRIALHHSIDIEDGQRRFLESVAFREVVQVRT